MTRIFIIARFSAFDGAPPFCSQVPYPCFTVFFLKEVRTDSLRSDLVRKVVSFQEMNGCADIGVKIFIYIYYMEKKVFCKNVFFLYTECVYY